MKHLVFLVQQRSVRRSGSFTQNLFKEIDVGYIVIDILPIEMIGWQLNIGWQHFCKEYVK